MSWSFFATTLDGKGNESLLVADLPLSGAEVTLALSGADVITGKISPEYPELIGADGRPTLVPWQTAIYAEENGVIRAGGLLESVAASGAELTLTIIGFSDYPAGFPWVGTAKRLYDKDPAEMFRLIWDHVQAQPGGNLGLTVSSITTKGRVGKRVTTPYVQPKPTTSTKTTKTATSTKTVTTKKTTTYDYDHNTVVTDVTTVTKPKTGSSTTTRRVTTVTTWSKTRKRETVVETYTGSTRTGRSVTTTTLPAGTTIKVRADTVESDEPFVLADYETHDLGQKLDELAAAGPFDWREMHQWSADRQSISHTLRLGSPRIGTRRNDLGLSVGINVELPSGSISAKDYASDVLAMGAGEGDKAVRKRVWSASPARLRRAVMVQHRDVSTATGIQQRATAALSAMGAGAQDVTELEVVDHPMCPLASLEPGDELYLEGPAGWLGDLGQWVRVTSVKFSMSEQGRAVLSVVDPNEIETTEQ